MLMQTHFYIGKVISRILNKNMRVYLNEESFKIGNAKPDFIPSLIRIPHYKSQSFEFILDMIYNIQLQSIPSSKKEMKAFSSSLGVINHFLTDYFCLAHNNNECDRMPYHFIYEFNLSTKITRLDFSEISQKSFKAALKSSISDKYWFKNYINEMHYIYLKQTPGIISDINFSMEVCMTVTQALIMKCIANEKMDAA